MQSIRFFLCRIFKRLTWAGFLALLTAIGSIGAAGAAYYAATTALVIAEKSEIERRNHVDMMRSVYRALFYVPLANLKAGTHLSIKQLSSAETESGDWNISDDEIGALRMLRPLLVLAPLHANAEKLIYFDGTDAQQISYVMSSATLLSEHIDTIELLIANHLSFPYSWRLHVMQYLMKIDSELSKLEWVKDSIPR